MIFGAWKRTVTVELLSYAMLALAAVVLAVVLPGFVNVPGWVIFVLMIAAQLWLYRRFYGRL